MTIAPLEQRSERRTHLAGALLASVAAGLLFGPLDLAGQVWLPYPWFEVANSAAVWAAVAFVLGRAMRTQWLPAAACGAVFLTVGVEAYYLAAVVTLSDSAANLTSPSTVRWVVFGLIAGMLFGAAGARSRDARDLPAAVATALGASVLFADALALRHAWGAAALSAVLGAILVLFAAGTLRRRLLAIAAAVPLTALAVAALAAAGFSIG